MRADPPLVVIHDRDIQNFFAIARGAVFDLYAGFFEARDRVSSPGLRIKLGRGFAGLELISFPDLPESHAEFFGELAKLCDGLGGDGIDASQAHADATTEDEVKVVGRDAINGDGGFGFKGEEAGSRKREAKRGVASRDFFFERRLGADLAVHEEEVIGWRKQRYAVNSIVRAEYS
jgi:hypothetical protein